jgi:pyruvate dehydrogenase E1 component alpha subunit
MTYFGDGAARQDLHEAFNMVCYGITSCFIVENNGYRNFCRKNSKPYDIWKLGLGYEMPCGPVDGMNPKVAEAMTEAIDRARREDLHSSK